MEKLRAHALTTKVLPPTATISIVHHPDQECVCVCVGGFGREGVERNMLGTLYSNASFGFGVK